MVSRWICSLLLFATPALCRAQHHTYDLPGVCDGSCGDSSCCDAPVECNQSCDCDCSLCALLDPKSGTCSSIWVQADYLGWYYKGNDTPPLVTSSPPGTARTDAGVLGDPDTNILFGGRKIDDDYRSGVSLRGGMWLDECNQRAIEIGYLTIFDDTNEFAASTQSQFGLGNGLPILARPFFNVVTGLEDSELVSYPSVVDGLVGVRTSSELETAEILYRANQFSSCNHRLDFLVGYRYFRFEESLLIGEDLVVTETGGLLVPGTQFQLYDQFETDNMFHGAQFGLLAEYWRDYFSLELRAKVALGGITRKSLIDGGTRVTVPPPGGTSESVGGLLALSPNIGSYRDSSFAVLPEFGANLKALLMPNVEVSVGYTLLLLNDVARTGGQIDRQINPGFIPGAVLVDPTRRPAFQADESDFYAHGLNIGLTVTR